MKKKRNASYAKAMAAFMKERARLGISDDPVAELVHRLHRAFSLHSAAKSEVFLPADVGRKTGSEGRHHQWMRALLHATAHEIGFSERYSFPGCRPDVLLMHRATRCLFVGDAKDSEQQRALDSQGQIDRYFDRLRDSLTDGVADAAIVAIITDNPHAGVEWMGRRGLSWHARSYKLDVVPTTTVARVTGDGVTWVITTAVRLPVLPAR